MGFVEKLRSSFKSGKTEGETGNRQSLSHGAGQVYGAAKKEYREAKEAYNGVKEKYDHWQEGRRTKAADRERRDLDRAIEREERTKDIYENRGKLADLREKRAKAEAKELNARRKEVGNLEARRSLDRRVDRANRPRGGGMGGGFSGPNLGDINDRMMDAIGGNRGPGGALDDVTRDLKRKGLI